MIGIYILIVKSTDIWARKCRNSSMKKGEWVHHEGCEVDPDSGIIRGREEDQ